MTSLPTPAQWVLAEMTEYEVAELLEKYIDFVDKDGNSVHCPTPFVRHYLKRDDGALPTVVAISTLPIVLADGNLLAPDGLDRRRGIVFKIEPQLMKLMPRREDCDAAAVCRAMRFLTDEWLADVATDYTGKCCLIGLAFTLIERSLLDQRPVWFVTAVRRGSGKTTTITMLIEAVTGIAPAAAAWSTNEEERRKALLSYFMYGVAYILWDNITRGTQISCPHVEKSCTAAYYSDRKLGVSEMVATAASTIHLFTGNNIGPKGDLASRSLQVRLDTDRIDPENRDFAHPDPIAWTRENRAEILQALYTILLGNPTLDLPRDASMKTRFKMWHRLVGSAVEHAAQCVANADPDRGEVPDPVLDFGTLFLDQEEDEEEAASLAEALDALDVRMAAQGKTPFKAADVCELINAPSDMLGATVRGFFCPNLAPGALATPKSVGRLLKNHVGAPVKHGQRTLTLKKLRDAHDEILRYFVRIDQ
jgi:hypothetical protein